jgi:hypothetical protein
MGMGENAKWMKTKRVKDRHRTESAFRKFEDANILLKKALTGESACPTWLQVDDLEIKRIAPLQLWEAREISVE